MTDISPQNLLWSAWTCLDSLPAVVGPVACALLAMLLPRRWRWRRIFIVPVFTYLLLVIALLAALRAIIGETMTAMPLMRALLPAAVTLTLAIRRRWLRLSLAIPFVMLMVVTTAFDVLVGVPMSPLGQPGYIIDEGFVARPLVIDGYALPPGTMLMRTQDGAHMAYAQFDRAVRIGGMSFVDFFYPALHAGRANDLPFSEATLAAEAAIEGVPCAPGPVMSGGYDQVSMAVRPLGDDAFGCTLARDLPLAGIVFKSGNAIVYQPPLRPGEPPAFVEGSLAKPATIAGAEWPAGSELTLRHADAPMLLRWPWRGGLIADAPSASIPDDSAPGASVCLPDGVTQSWQGYAIHGMAEADFFAQGVADLHAEWASCSAPDAGEPGAIERDGARYWRIKIAHDGVTARPRDLKPDEDVPVRLAP